MPPELHMVQVDLRLSALLSVVYKRYQTQDPDLGYAVHQALTEGFGPALAPKPFALLEGGRHLRLLGYTAQPGPALADHASTYAAPDVHQVFDWSTLASKPMPTQWQVGRRLGFRVVTAPVVRLGHDRTGPHPKQPGNTTTYPKGSELDAYQAHRLRLPTGGEQHEAVPSRHSVYRAWLVTALTRERQPGQPPCLDAQVWLDSFQLVRVHRRQQAGEREGRRITLPKATFTGELTVGPGFANLLRRGVGRHRSFGFGMVLLRPVEG